MSVANFDIIEYQKRVIADLTAENKALKEALKEDCAACKHYELLVSQYPCRKCSVVNKAYKVNYWEWKGVDGK